MLKLFDPKSWLPNRIVPLRIARMALAIVGLVPPAAAGGVAAQEQRQDNRPPIVWPDPGALENANSGDMLNYAGKVSASESGDPSRPRKSWLVGGTIAAYLCWLLAVFLRFIIFYLKMEKDYDIRKKREKHIRGYAWPPGLLERFAKHYPSLTQEDEELVSRGLKQFFTAYLNGGRQYAAMPTRIVDDLWHEFILYTRAYEEFCEQAFGRFLHHTPAVALSTDRTAHKEEGMRRIWLGVLQARRRRSQQSRAVAVVVRHRHATECPGWVPLRAELRGLARRRRHERPMLGGPGAAAAGIGLRLLLTKVKSYPARPHGLGRLQFTGRVSKERRRHEHADHLSIASSNVGQEADLQTPLCPGVRRDRVRRARRRVFPGLRHQRLGQGAGRRLHQTHKNGDCADHLLHGDIRRRPYRGRQESWPSRRQGAGVFRDRLDFRAWLGPRGRQSRQARLRVFRQGGSGGGRQIRGRPRIAPAPISCSTSFPTAPSAPSPRATFCRCCCSPFCSASR